MAQTLDGFVVEIRKNLWRSGAAEVLKPERLIESEFHLLWNFLGSSESIICIKYELKVLTHDENQDAPVLT